MSVSQVSSLRTAAAALALLLLARGAARAQGGPEPVTPAATIVQVRSLAPGTGAVVQRGGSPPRNLVLVTAGTTPATLAAALAVLADSRRRNGEEPVGRLVAHVPDAPPGAAGPELAARLERDLERLRSAAPRLVEGYGTVPAIVVALAPLPPPDRREP